MGLLLGNMFSYASMMFTKNHDNSWENSGGCDPHQIHMLKSELCFYDDLYPMWLRPMLIAASMFVQSKV